MPIFEYKCQNCDERFEILVKSVSAEGTVSCPSCHSAKPQKLFSTFAAKSSASHDHDFGGCADGACGMPPAGGCANGMCGFN